MWTAKQVLTLLSKRRGITRLEGLAQPPEWDDILRAMQVLQRRGLAETIESGRYRITEEGRKLLIADAALGVCGDNPKPKARKSLRRRAWWVIRKSKKVTVNSILSTLADGKEKNAANNIRDYLRQLTGAGFLVPMKRQRGQRGYKRWLLINDPGPLAPVWRQKGNGVFDPNSGQTISLSKGVDCGENDTIMMGDRL